MQPGEVRAKARNTYGKRLVVFGHGLGLAQSVRADYIKLDVGTTHIHVRLDQRDKFARTGWASNGGRMEFHVEMIGPITHGIQRFGGGADQCQRTILVCAGHCGNAGVGQRLALFAPAGQRSGQHTKVVVNGQGVCFDIGDMLAVEVCVHFMILFHGAVVHRRIR